MNYRMSSSQHTLENLPKL